jgi:hypothetical protein
MVLLVVAVFAAAFAAALTWPHDDKGGSEPLAASVESMADEVATGDELVVEVRVENRGAEVVELGCGAQLNGQLVPLGGALDPDEQFWPLSCAVEDEPLAPGDSYTQQLAVAAVSYDEDGPENLAPGEYDLAFATSDPEMLALPESVTVTVTVTVT